MSFTQQLPARIGRQALNPQPIPPGYLVALNPQPIPPGEPEGLAGLNPQPIPPREYGVMMARELLRLSWQAGKLGIEPAPASSWDENWCPVGEKAPVLPPYFPPNPDPEPGPDWTTEYLLGVAGALAASHDGSTFVTDAFDHASRALAKSLE